MQPPRWLLPVIIFSQFTGTSLWFAGNAVLDNLTAQWQLPDGALGTITSAVQLGFIFGTLVFAFLAIPDRFSPRKIFLICALCGAMANTSITLIPHDYGWLLACRFLTGFFLAGLYPVGMKIAAGWYKEGLGKALGFLVGALVLGTAFPHLLNSLGSQWLWQEVIISVSCLAITGGIALYLMVPDGPYHSKGAPFNPKALAIIFRSRKFRASAFGYFGHMWELYAFWAFIPVYLSAHFALNGITNADLSLWAFFIIGIGSLGCAGGGLLSQRLGSAKVATLQLSVSGLCCLLSPILFFAPTPILLAFLLLWGLTVAGDSPQFSALNAQNSPPTQVGSALTIVNSIGFAISILSIELLNQLSTIMAKEYLYLILLIGPIFGLFSMRPLLRTAPAPGE